MVASGGGSPPARQAAQQTGTTPDQPQAPTAEALARFTAEAGAEEAVRRLGHEAWLRRRSEETGHLIGLLLDVAERRDPVGVSLTNGDHRNGRIEVVGSDFVGLRLDDGGLSLLGLGAITALRLETGGADLVGDRATPVDRLDFHSVLERLLADQPRVAIVLEGATTALPGTLERLGRDIILVKADDGSAVHVPITARVEVRLSPGS